MAVSEILHLPFPFIATSLHTSTVPHSQGKETKGRKKDRKKKESKKAIRSQLLSLHSWKTQ